MKQFDIYVSFDGEEATSHGAEYVFCGYNAADALTRFVADEDAIDELRHDHLDFDELAAFDGELSASLFPLDDGSWELHIHHGFTDDVITIPPTEFVSVTDAADMLGITRQRVQTLVVNGKLNGHMVGSTWMITRASVEKRMES